jgi:hypothetical protein
MLEASSRPANAGCGRQKDKKSHHYSSIVLP